MCGRFDRLAGLLLAIERRPVLAGLAFAFAASVNFTALVAAIVLCVWAFRRWSRTEVAKLVAIVGGLGAAIEKLKAERMASAEPCRSATFITGPSRTSDVELVLSIGVHGPKELHLIILGE